MKQVFLDIQKALQTSSFTLPNDPTTGNPIVLDANGCVFLYNHQLEDLEKGERPEYPQVSFFVEFINPITFKQGGNGMQFAVYKLRIYIVHHFYLATDGYDGGQGDQDLTIFDLKGWAYLTLQKFQPTNTGEMVRVTEAVDYSHTDVNCYMMEFNCITNDYYKVEPVGGTEITAPTSAVKPSITISI